MIGIGALGGLDRRSGGKKQGPHEGREGEGGYGQRRGMRKSENESITFSFMVMPGRGTATSHQPASRGACNEDKHGKGGEGGSGCVILTAQDFLPLLVPFHDRTSPAHSLMQWRGWPVVRVGRGG